MTPPHTQMTKAQDVAWETSVSRVITSCCAPCCAPGVVNMPSTVAKTKHTAYAPRPSGRSSRASTAWMAKPSSTLPTRVPNTTSTS